MKSLDTHRIFLVLRNPVLWIVLCGALLRLYGLGEESLWLDEALTNQRIAHGYKTLLTDWDSERQGPLYAVIEKTWCDLFGDDEFQLRFPAVLFGIIAVFMIYRFGKELFGEDTGVLAAFFAAISPFMIYFSQEARPYTLFILCSIASLQYFVRILRGYSSSLDKFLFIFFAVCALHSHPFGPFLVVTYIFILLGYSLLERESFTAILRRIRISALTVAMLCAPMLFIFARTFVRKIDNPSIAGSWLFSPPFTEITDTFVDYFMSVPISIATGVLIVGVIGRKILKNRSFDFPLIVLLSLLLAFILTPWAISKIITPIYLYKYTAPALGAVLVLLAYALSLIPMKPRIVIIVTLAVLHIVPLYDSFAKVDKDPWRQTAAFVEKECKPNDMILLMPFYVASSFKYYYRDQDGVLFRCPGRLTAFESIPEDIERVWFVFAYYQSPLQGQAVFDTLSNWGTAAATIHMKETQIMNPNHYYATEIDVTKFDRK
jgi:mannosyltransferase